MQKSAKPNFYMLSNICQTLSHYQIDSKINFFQMLFLSENCFKRYFPAFETSPNCTLFLDFRALWNSLGFRATIMPWLRCMNKKFSHDGESIPNFLFISKIEQSWILGVPKAKRVQNFFKRTNSPLHTLMNNSTLFRN